MINSISKTINRFLPEFEILLIKTLSVILVVLFFLFAITHS